MHNTKRKFVVSAGILLAATLAGGCGASRNYTITFKEQPTTLVSTDRLGGAMFDDRTALAAAVRSHRSQEIRTASAPEPTR